MMCDTAIHCRSIASLSGLPASPLLSHSPDFQIICAVHLTWKYAFRLSERATEFSSQQNLDPVGRYGSHGADSDRAYDQHPGP